MILHRMRHKQSLDVTFTRVTPGHSGARIIKGSSREANSPWTEWRDSDRRPPRGERDEGPADAREPAHERSAAARERVGHMVPVSMIQIRTFGRAHDNCGASHLC